MHTYVHMYVATNTAKQEITLPTYQAIEKLQVGKESASFL